MKEIIIYLRNYGVYLFLIFIFFANISFVIESLKNFDNFVFNPTKTINGVILKKDFTDGMDGNTFAIKASYKINNSIFFLSSTISEYSFLINSKKDSIKLTYNIQKPHKSTLKTKDEIDRQSLFGLFLLVGALYSIIFLLKKIFFNKKH